MNSKLKILLVEDDDNDRILLDEYLKTQGWDFKLVRVYNEDTLSSELRDHVFDIIIIDYMLPGYSCLGAIKHIRGLSIDSPIIVMSNKVDEDDVVEEVMAAGAQDYVQKIKMERLGPAIKRELISAQKRKRIAQVEKSNEMVTKLLFKLSSSLNWVLQHKLKDISFDILLEDFGKILNANRTYIYKRCGGCQQCGPGGVCYKLDYIWSYHDCTYKHFEDKFKIIYQNEYPRFVSKIEHKNLFMTNKHICDLSEGSLLKILKAGALTGAPILNSDGSVYGFFGFDVRDVRKCNPIEKSAIQAITAILGTIVYKIEEEQKEMIELEKTTKKIDAFSSSIEETISRLESRLG